MKKSIEIAYQPLVTAHSKLVQNMTDRLTEVEKMDNLVEQFFALKALRLEWRSLSEKVTSDFENVRTDLANKTSARFSAWLAGGIVALTAVAGLASGGAAAFLTFTIALTFGSLAGMASEVISKGVPENQFTKIADLHREKTGMTSLVTRLDKTYVENVEKAAVALAQSPRFTEAYDDANTYEKTVLRDAFAQVAQASTPKSESEKPSFSPQHRDKFRL